jgi:hypothetical protein
LFVISALLFAVFSHASVPPSLPFSTGEKATYAITYFGATAGILDVEILAPSVENGKTWAEYSAKARTDSIFSLFYSLKNVYRSTVDSSTGLPIRWVATLDETRQQGTTSQEFDQTKRRVHFRDQRVDKKKGKIDKDFTKTIPTQSQDVVSAMFHLRSLPLAVGKSFEVPVFIGEEPCLLRVEVVNLEDINTKIGTVSAYVLKPSLLKDGQVKEIPDTLVWIAKDHDRALLKVKAKVKIGSIIAYLRSYEPGKKVQAK